jgi:ABC-2 type transport system permease protein
VTRIALIVRKDLRILLRSPVLLGMLLAYPLVIAVLVGLVAGYANSKPRVALVDQDGLPRKVVLAGETFNVQKTIDRVSENVNLVRLPRADAQRELRNGKLVAVLTVPRGFMADLRGMLHSPELRLQTAHGTLSNRVEQQVQALVYSLNRLLQDAYIKTNLGYVDALKHGATITFLGRKIDVLGLDRTAALLRKLPPSQRRARIEDFVHDAQLALRETDSAMRATANPIKLVLAPRSGRSWALSAEVQAYALGLTIAFLTLLLAAGALAAERDENVIGRLARGLVRFGQLIWAKVLLAAVVGLLLGGAIAVVFGLIIQAGGIVGGEPWDRIPLLLLGIALTAASLGALGTVVGGLSRDGRTASLVALIVVLPIVLLGVVPSEFFPAAGWVSDAFPFTHGVRIFDATLYDASPWRTLVREALWLTGLGALFGFLGRAAAPRLLT